MSLTTIASAALITPSLTTTFIPSATTCTENRLTMLENRAYQIWMNVPVPVPSSTFDDCYPSQYLTSFLLEAGGVTQPAFDPLVCPQGYSTIGPYTSNYIACCPSDYSLAPPTVSVVSTRPAFGGTCYSPLPSGIPFRVTAYGSDGVTATTTFAATTTNAQAFAYPYEGYAFGVAELASLTTPATAAASSTSTAAASTHTVLADTDSVFTPTSVNASVGDTVLFLFESGDHTVTQSTFDTPCIAKDGGVDTGYMNNINNTDATTPEFSYNVSSTASQWFFSKQTGDCGKGMTFALNPTSDQTEAAFKAAAISQNGTAASTNSSSDASSHSKNVAIGLGVGLGSLALILAAAAFFFIYRRKQQKSQSQAKEIGYTSTAQTPEEYGSWEWREPVKSEELHATSTPISPVDELHGKAVPAELSGSGPVELPASTKSFFDTGPNRI